METKFKDQNPNEQVQGKSSAKLKRSKAKITSIRIDQSTADILNSFARKINDEKKHGRAIRPKDILKHCVQFLNQEIASLLKESSLSEKDRQEQIYLDYCSQNGHVKRQDYERIVTEKLRAALLKK